MYTWCTISTCIENLQGGASLFWFSSCVKSRKTSNCSLSQLKPLFCWNVPWCHLCSLSWHPDWLLSISGQNITDTFGENNYFGSQVHFDVFILGLVTSQVGTERMTVCQMRRQTKPRHDFSMNRLFHSCVKSLALKCKPSYQIRTTFSWRIITILWLRTSPFSEATIQINLVKFFVNISLTSLQKWLKKKRSTAPLICGASSCNWPDLIDCFYIHLLGSGGNKPIAFMLLKLGPPSRWHVFNYFPISVGSNI